ncbi:MAG: ABC transporter ATP-binding protein [Eubacteriales bacterium]|nr:ABC transporter ATP-binding protein [Eubacteriales bacterium]
METYVTETRDLTKYYHDFCALNKVNISIRRGEIYGLVGDNGAGKSTFLKLLAGQIFPSSGELQLFGKHQQKELAAMRSRMGVIIENPGFYPNMSVEKNLEYFRIQKGIPGKQAIEEVMEITGLTRYRKKTGKTLSLGMKQRLGLAIALLGVPEVLLLDEPINGLDPSGIIEMRNLLVKLNKEKNITILISSHILSELEQIATVYGFLQNGCLLEQISAEKLHKKCSDYVEILVSDPEQYMVLLEQKMNHNDYQLLPDGKIHILNAKNGPEEFGELAGNAGIRILELSKCQKSLEDYYMNLKNGGAKKC